MRKGNRNKTNNSNLISNNNFNNKNDNMRAMKHYETDFIDCYAHNKHDMTHMENT